MAGVSRSDRFRNEDMRGRMSVIKEPAERVEMSILRGATQGQNLGKISSHFIAESGRYGYKPPVSVYYLQEKIFFCSQNVLML